MQARPGKSIDHSKQMKKSHVVQEHSLPLLILASIGPIDPIGHGRQSYEAHNIIFEAPGTPQYERPRRKHG